MRPRSEKTAQPATMAMTERSSLPHISWQDTTGTGCCTRAKGGRLRQESRAVVGIGARLYLWRVFLSKSVKGTQPEHAEVGMGSRGRCGLMQLEEQRGEVESNIRARSVRAKLEVGGGSTPLGVRVRRPRIRRQPRGPHRGRQLHECGLTQHLLPSTTRQQGLQKAATGGGVICILLNVGARNLPASTRQQRGGEGEQQLASRLAWEKAQHTSGE